MSRFVVVASIVALAAVGANCANDPGQANSIGSIVPSSVMAASSDATLSTLAKGGKPVLTAGDSTIDPVYLDSTDGVAHFGQQLTFHFSTASAYRYVTLRCYQAGPLVGEQTLARWRGTVCSQTFTLGGSAAWTGGAADCTATLEDRYASKNGAIIALASTTFPVAP